MKRFAIKLRVYESKGEEFRKRYKEVWPELLAVAKRHGIKNLAIYMDEDTNEVTCFFKCHEQWNEEAFLNEEFVLLWRLSMYNLLDSDMNHIPIIHVLNEVFYFTHKTDEQ